MSNEKQTAIRKNIYVPIELVEDYKTAEEYAKKNGISMSRFILTSTKFYIENTSKPQEEIINEGTDEQEINLLVKEIMFDNYKDKHFSQSSVISEKIKFKGKWITSSTFKDDKNLVEYNENDKRYYFNYNKTKHRCCNVYNYIEEKDKIGYWYHIYKTEKGKFVLCIQAIHSRLNKSPHDKNDHWTTICDEHKYKIYENYEEMLSEANNLTCEEVNQLMFSILDSKELDI